MSRVYPVCYLFTKEQFLTLSLKVIECVLRREGGASEGGGMLADQLK